MQLGLGIGLSKQRKGVIAGEIPAVGGDPPGSFDGFETPPTVETIVDTIVVRGKTKAGFIGKFVVPLGDFIADRVYNVNFVADLSGLAQGGAKSGFGFGMKNGNSFRLTLLQGDGVGVNATIVRGSPPNGWNKQTGHTTANGGAPTSGTQHAADVQLVTNAGGDAYTFSTSGDDQETWDAELEDQALTPFADIMAVEQFGIAGWFASDDAGEFTITVTWTEEEAVNWTPEDINDGTLMGWYDASDAATITSFGGLVSQWSDKSTIGNHLVQATDSRKPTTGTRTQNSLNVLDFDGGDTLVDTSATLPDGNPGLTVLAVVAYDAQVGGWMMFATNAAASDFSWNLGRSGSGPGTTNVLWAAYSGTNAVSVVNDSTAWQVFSGIATLNLRQLWVNAVSQGTNTNTDTEHTAGRLYVGADNNPGTFINGGIAELLVIAGTDATIRANAETYLMNKWGIG